MFITLIYAVSALFSVVMYAVGLTIYESETYRPTLLPTIIYCSLIYLCLYPFLKYSNLRFHKIHPVKNERFLIILSWISVVWFILTFYVYINAITQVLNGDFAALRNALHSGDRISNEALKLPLIIRKLWALLNYIFKCPWVMIFFAFYAKFVQRLSWKYFFFFLLASTTTVMEGIVGIDRSKVTYWLIAIGANYLFFFKYVPTKEKKQINVSLIVLVFFAIFYLSIATNSRFGDREYDNSAVSGSLGGVLLYLGQPYPNFCYFFDNFKSSWTTLANIFPTYYYLFYDNEPVGSVLIQTHLDTVTNVERTGVFYTFIGALMVMSGFFTALIYCFFYYLISNIFLKRLFKNDTTIISLFLYQALSSILILGLFGYYYAEPLLDLSVILSFLLIKLSFNEFKY